MRTLVLFALVAGVAACGSSAPTEAPAPAEAPVAEAPVAEAPAAPAEQAFGEVSLDELKTLVAEKKAVLIDANGTSSFKEGHIPGAIDFEAAGETLATALPADKAALVVAYCGGPTCNAWKGAAEAVAKLGYTQVKHFPGGMSGWKDAQGTVEL